MSNKVVNEEKTPAIQEENVEAASAVESDMNLKDESEVDKSISETDCKASEIDSCDCESVEQDIVPETESVAKEEESVLDVELVVGSEPIAYEVSAVADSDDNFQIVKVSESFTVSTPDKEAIILRLAEIVVQEINNNVKSEVELLKQSFYRLRSTETEELRNAFIAAGGVPEDFKPTPDETENRLKELLAVFREKKAKFIAQNEKFLEENLHEKKAIIERLKELTENNESSENFNKIREEYRKLTQQWKEIKHVPQSAMNELWKQYQYYNEKFYDLQKINFAMRDYDFKKNLEQKQALCEIAEKLSEEEDIVSAYYSLNKLYLEWHEIGPVAKEFREEIWTRLKLASSVINKKYQHYLKVLLETEKRNLEEKIKCCEELENIDCFGITTFKEWDDKTKEVFAIQEKWKTLGDSRKKDSRNVFVRFRTACDKFFDNREAFRREYWKELDTNLEKKLALCKRAEALKDSQEWRETTGQMLELRKEWKTTGRVAKKYSDAVWNRFNQACDYFFTQKSNHISSNKTEAIKNLEKKKEIINKIKEIDTTLSTKETIEQIRSLMSEWHQTGFIPSRDREKLQKQYRIAVDKQFDRLKIDESERRLQSFKSSVEEIDSGDERLSTKLLSEREKLLRVYERLKIEIQTYENNIGFLSVKSKDGGVFLKDMNIKIQNLKDELELIAKKIDVIDEKFENR
jgi:hypothetical protein